MNKQIKNICICSVAAALISVLSPISLPIGVISVTLSLFIIYTLAAILKPYQILIALLIYVIIGAIGLPVFSNFKGGISVLFGITGGYIVGYFPAVLIISFMVYKHKDKVYLYPISMVIGTVICYLIGTVWFVLVAQTTFIYALSVCVVPFIIFDLIKIAFATIISYLINKKNLKIINE